jgi:hypothetical protein
MRACFLVLFALAACDEPSAANARRQIREVHVAEITHIVRDDVARHRRGTRELAKRLAPGFAIADAADRERQIRAALRVLQEAPRGIPELIASPMTFCAAIGPDGIVIARDVRDADEDRMKGQNFGERFESVRDALRDGNARYELGEFPAESGPPSYAMVFVAPARHRGEIVGAAVVGIPLRTMAARIGRQLKLDHPETGLEFWVYAYRGDMLFHTGTPTPLDPLVPNEAARNAGFERSPHGYTGEVLVGERPYGYVVLPTPIVGEDTGLVFFRADPPDVPGS